MKLKQIVTESAQPDVSRILTEASMSRIYQHIKNGRALAAISAYRGINTKDENMADGRKLANYVKAAGYGFFWVDGQYWEEFDGTEQEWKQFLEDHPHLRKHRERNGKFEYHVKERSIYIIGRENDSGNLFGLMKKLCKRFDQDSFLFKAPGSDVAAFYRRDGAKEFEVGKFRPQKMTDFSSVLRNRDPFVFESEEHTVNIFEPLNAMGRWRQSLETKPR